MAPRGASTWRRPYTSIYNENYKYGTGLYSNTLSDIEKRYSDSLSRTQLRSDRPDLAFSSFLGSNLTSSPTPAGEPRPISVPSSPVKELLRSSTFESRLNTALHSSYLEDEDITERRPIQKSKSTDNSRPGLYDDASLWSLPKSKSSEKSTSDFKLEFPKSRRKKAAGDVTPTNGPSAANWREKSRDLQYQVESLERSMSDSSSKLKNDMTTLRSKCHTEISDLSSSVEQTSQQSNELQKTVKRQAHQLTELQTAYDEAQKNLQDTLEEMGTWQNRCKNLKKEMERLREEVEQALQKSSSKA